MLVVMTGYRPSWGGAEIARWPSLSRIDTNRREYSCHGLLSAGPPPTPMEHKGRRWHKTDLSRRLLNDRGAMPPAWRMWLITVDGRRGEPELLALAAGLGLDGRALIERLAREGWITDAAASPASPAAPATPARRRLAAARMFAIDLAARMLAGRDAELRESWREVQDEASFQRWLGDCAGRIAEAAGPDRAALFVQRVELVLTESNLPA